MKILSVANYPDAKRVIVMYKVQGKKFEYSYSFQRGLHTTKNERNSLYSFSKKYRKPIKIYTLLLFRMYYSKEFNILQTK